MTRKIISRNFAGFDKMFSEPTETVEKPEI